MQLCLGFITNATSCLSVSQILRHLFPQTENGKNCWLSYFKDGIRGTYSLEIWGKSPVQNQVLESSALGTHQDKSENTFFLSLLYSHEHVISSLWDESQIECESNSICLKKSYQNSPHQGTQGVLLRACDGSFCVSTWLGHRVPRYLVKHYSGCFLWEYFGCD